MNDLHVYVEYAQLQNRITASDVDQAVQVALTGQLSGLCLPPYWVKKASRDLANTPVQLITPIGYPLGYQRTEAKIAELELAFADGADSVELVINLSAFKSRCLHWVKAEVARFAHWVHARESLLTVSTDMHLLDTNEIQSFCKVSADAGADYIKTGTGYGSESATVERIALLKKSLPGSVGIKVWTEAESSEQLHALIAAGAEKIATPSLNSIRQKAGKFA